jgi:hypothetical protein
MSGKLKAAVFVSLALAVTLALFSLSRHDADADFGFTYATTLTSSTPMANSNSFAPFNVLKASPLINQDNANFAKLDTSLAPPGFNPVLDSQIPDGAKVGQVSFTATLGLINGPCNSPVSGTIEVMDSTTNTYDTADFKGTGVRLLFDDDGIGAVTAEDTNDVPTYADDYPSFLNQLFDPDGIGATPPIRPRFRYSGHVQVLNGAPPTILNLVGFNPGDLATLPLPEAALNDEFGYINFVILNDPTAAAAPSTITDFCATDSNTDLLGLTSGQLQIIDPAGPAPNFQPEINAFVIQCGNSVDNDADTVADDGCFTLNTGVNAGIVRVESPAAGTGIYGGSTHVYRALGQSFRDHDGDRISNDVDSCPFNVDAVPPVDGDSDGLFATCDPNDGAPSAVAPSPDGVDNDGDTVNSEDPVNNNDDDGDTLLDEDGNCSGTSGLPDQDQDCYANRGDNCSLLANDNSDLDGTIPAGSPADGGPQTDSLGDTCDPSPPAGESGAGCAAGNTADNAPVDGRVNDGCPQVGTRPETGVECQNAINDDGDASVTTAVVNDGCPPAGGGTQNGVYHSAIVLAYNCIGGTDTDGDGVCNAEETLLGSIASGGGAAASTPEYYGLAYSPVTVTGDVCSNRTEYPSPAGTAIDDDGDTLANAADTGPGATCGSDPVVGSGADSDSDGVANTSDNCSSAYNPTQTDTDGDASGDACDLDDDDDLINDRIESFMGTDPKDNCADNASDPANPSDADNNTQVNVGDLVQLFGGGKILVAPPNPLYQSRSDFDANQQVNVGDLVQAFGGGKILTDCDANMDGSPASVWSLPKVSGTHNCTSPAVLVFESKVINISGITDSLGGTWSATSGVGTSNLIGVTRSGGSAGSCVITVDNVNGRRTPRIESIGISQDIVDGKIGPGLNRTGVDLLVVVNGQVTTKTVNIINGQVDVEPDGDIDANDDLTGVVLRVTGGGTVTVNIINGDVDVNRNGSIGTEDDQTGAILEKNVP